MKGARQRSMKGASKTNQSAGKRFRISYQITSNATMVTNAGKFGLRDCSRAWSGSSIDHSGRREETEPNFTDCTANSGLTLTGDYTQ
jgi:hypothetical protein